MTGTMADGSQVQAQVRRYADGQTHIDGTTWSNGSWASWSRVTDADGNVLYMYINDLYPGKTKRVFDVDGLERGIRIVLGENGGAATGKEPIVREVLLNGNTVESVTRTFADGRVETRGVTRTPQGEASEWVRLVSLDGTVHMKGTLASGNTVDLIIHRLADGGEEVIGLTKVGEPQYIRWRLKSNAEGVYEMSDLNFSDGFNAPSISYWKTHASELWNGIPNRLIAPTHEVLSDGTVVDSENSNGKWNGSDQRNNTNAEWAKVDLVAKGGAGRNGLDDRESIGWEPGGRHEDDAWPTGAWKPAGRPHHQTERPWTGCE